MNVFEKDEDCMVVDRTKCDKHDQEIREIQIQLTKIDSTVEHIKGRIDNGMSTTIQKIFDNIQTLSTKIESDIMPAVKDSTFWVGWVKKCLAIVFIIGVARIVWDKISWFLQ